MPQPTLVFDLDGTLVDTAPDLTNSVNHVLHNRGFSPLSEQDFRLMVGQGARKMVIRAFAAYGITHTEKELDSIVEEFLAFYAKNISTHSKPFPGVLAQLDMLNQNGATLAVCTNKSETLARSLLENLSIDHYFSAIVGGDTLPIKKPDPLHITTTVERAGGDNANAIMIGDSAADINAANAANIPVIAVTFGYSKPDFDGAIPTLTIDHYDALPAALRTLEKRKI